jgi:hypothetical protein
MTEEKNMKSVTKPSRVKAAQEVPVNEQKAFAEEQPAKEGMVNPAPEESKEILTDTLVDLSKETRVIPNGETNRLLDQNKLSTEGEPVDEEIKEEALAIETVIYIGESLRGGELQQFSTFKNGLPVTVEKHIEECPAIQSLIVPVSNLAQARQNLLIQATSEYVLNEQVKSYTRGEN